MNNLFTVRFLVLSICITASVSLFAQDGSEYYNQGRMHCNDGNHMAAIEDYTKCISLNYYPDSSFFYRGYCRLESGDTSAAYQDWSNAIAIKPTNELARFNRAMIIDLNYKDYKRMVAELDTVIGLDAAYSDAYYYRANARYLLGDVKGTLEDFKACIKLKPLNDTMYFNRGVLLEEIGNVKAAMDDYEKAIEINPSNNAGAYCNLGNIMFNSKKYQEALVCYDKAIRYDPKMKQAHYGRGLVNNTTNQDVLAIIDFSNAIAIDQNYERAYVGRGVAKSHLGFYEDALADYSRSIDITPGKENAIAYYNRGNMKVNLGDREGAVQDYQTALGYGYTDARKEIRRLKR